jgi:hypothetical protein
MKKQTKINKNMSGTRAWYKLKSQHTPGLEAQASAWIFFIFISGADNIFYSLVLGDRASLLPTI